MIPLLAQTSNFTSEQLGIWIAIALALLVGAVNIKQLLARKPPLHREYVDRETFQSELKNTHGRITRERGELNTEIDTIRRELKKISADGEARDVRIHDRIDRLATDVAETPRKTVELLRTTKGLL